MTFTLTGMLDQLAEEHPHSPALTIDDSTIDFAALLDRTRLVAAALARSGIRPGDRVGVLARNAPAFYEVVFGAAAVGAVTVGLNLRLAAAEIGGIVTDARPSLVLADADLRPLLPADVSFVELGVSYEQWLGAGAGAPPEHVVDTDDVVLQLYSSGTTGRAKGAMLTHANLGWTVRMGREFYRMDPTTVNLVPSPLFHIGGIGYSLTALGQGGHTVLVPAVDPAELLRLIGRHAVTHSFLVPTVISMLAEHPMLAAADLSSLQRIAYGGAPMTETALLRAIDVFGCDFMGVYGMTETAGTVVTLDPADHDPGGPRAGLLRSVGKALPWLDIRVVDPVTGADAAIGGVGEIWVRSGQNMTGYWGQPELSDQTLADGWLRTGDAAYTDADGYLYLHDRIKDMLVSGGENVYPAEVENVLGAHPAIADLAVIGVPSARWGETVKALVVLRADSVIDADGLIAWTRERLAHYKCPTSIDFVDELPRNASGKVLKHRLRAPYWAGHEPVVH